MEYKHFCRAACDALPRFCGKSRVEEEGELPLSLSSSCFCEKLCERHRQSVACDINESAWLGRLCARRRRASLKPVFYLVLRVVFEQLHMNTQAQSVWLAG
jgi:hypothetical protein